MSPPTTADADGLPIACTLGPDDAATRMRRWQALGAEAHATASYGGHMLEVRFERGPGVYAELVALVSAEQECCSFVSWTVTEDDDHLVLRVLANADSPDGVASIATLFGAN